MEECYFIVPNCIVVFIAKSETTKMKNYPQKPFLRHIQSVISVIAS